MLHVADLSLHTSDLIKQTHTFTFLEFELGHERCSMTPLLHYPSACREIFQMKRDYCDISKLWFWMLNCFSSREDLVAERNVTS